MQLLAIDLTTCWCSSRLGLTAVVVEEEEEVVVVFGVGRRKLRLSESLGFVWSWWWWWWWCSGWRWVVELSAAEVELGPVALD